MSQLKLNDNDTGTNDELVDKTYVLLNVIYPVGSVYYTTDKDFNPANSFGGSWSRVSGGLAYSKNAATSTGSESVTLTASNFPSHNFSVTPSGTVSGGKYTLSGSAATSTTTEGVTNTQPNVSISDGGLTFSGTATRMSSTITLLTTTSHSHKITIDNETLKPWFTIRPGRGVWGFPPSEHRCAPCWGGSNTTITDWDGDYTTKLLINGYDAYAGKVTLQSTHSHSLSFADCGNHTHTASGAVSYTPEGTITPVVSGTFSDGSFSEDSHTHTIGKTRGSVTCTAKPSFTGTSTSITFGSSSPTAINIMPPYYTAYCWKRTS